MPLVIGSRLGSYQVTAKIGEGGMGEVYRARDTSAVRCSLNRGQRRRVSVSAAVLVCGLLMVPAIVWAQSDDALLAEATVPLEGDARDARAGKVPLGTMTEDRSQVIKLCRGRMRPRRAEVIEARCTD